MPDLFPIDLDACRSRQWRLLAEMHGQDVGWAIVTQPENIQWLTGVRFPWFLKSVVAISADGKLTLIAPHKAPDAAAADDVVVYQAKWHSTARNDQTQAAMSALRDVLGDRLNPARAGVEFASFGQYLELCDSELVDFEPLFYRLRRRKDADELALIRKAIAGTERMYRRAREIVRPGVNELHVFNELQAAAVDEFREMLTATGNDYQCASRGGPPRDRCAAAGELYILDLGPAFRGYFADNCRTLAVSEPTDAQREAWTFIQKALAHVEATVRPGKNARELFHEVQAILDAAPLGVFNHHLGHGIGLFPHEAPHLNPRWDDVFEVGDVFTAEPGLYAPELNAGMRIENDYLVTETGVERLSNFSTEL